MTPQIKVSAEFFDYLIDRIDPSSRIQSLSNPNNLWIGGITVVSRAYSSLSKEDNIKEALADSFLIICNNYNRFLVRLAKDYFIIHGRS